MKQDSIPVPIDQRVQFPPEYDRRGEWPLEEAQPEADAFPPHAGGVDHDDALFAQINPQHIVHDDPDLADLDDIDYDTVVISGVRNLHVTVVRLEGNTLVPVKRDGENLNANIEAGSPRLNAHDGQIEGPSASGSST